MAADLSLYEMLQRTADAIHGLLGFPNVDLPLLEEEDERTLTIRIRGGSYKRQIRHEDRIPIDRGIMGAAIRELKTQRVDDVAADPRYVQPPSGLTMRAELAVPILHAGRPLGVVNVEGPETFSDLDVELLEMVADHLAIAITNARRVEQERRLAVVEERQRLARDLHDSVTQLLFSSTLLAESLPGALQEGRRRGGEEARSAHRPQSPRPGRDARPAARARAGQQGADRLFEPRAAAGVVRGAARTRAWSRRCGSSSRRSRRRGSACGSKRRRTSASRASARRSCCAWRRRRSPTSPSTPRAKDSVRLARTRRGRPLGARRRPRLRCPRRGDSQRCDLRHGRLRPTPPSGAPRRPRHPVDA